jgi:hypothetical protein
LICSLYVQCLKLRSQIGLFFLAGSVFAAERLNLNNPGCNPGYHTDLSSTTTEWLNIRESKNTSYNNSTTNVVE